MEYSKATCYQCYARYAVGCFDVVTMLMIMGQALKSLEGGCCVQRQGHYDLEGPMTWPAQETGSVCFG